MITIYQTTRPRFTDTKKILQEKYLQCLRDGPLDGGLSQTIIHADTSLRFADTEAIVLEKILQNCNGG